MEHTYKQTMIQTLSKPVFSIIIKTLEIFRGVAFDEGLNQCSLNFLLKDCDCKIKIYA
jgi:hypothetical protein